MTDLYGTGLITPITRAMGHLLFLTTALRVENYTLDLNTLVAEINDAKSNLANLQYPPELISNVLALNIENWRSNLIDLATQANDYSLEHPDSPASEFADRDLFKSLIEESWGLLAGLDEEALGVPRHMVLAGTLP